MKKYAIWLVIGGLAIDWIDDLTQATKGAAYTGIFYNPTSGILKSFTPASATWGLPEDIGVVAASIGAALMLLKD